MLRYIGVNRAALIGLACSFALPTAALAKDSAHIVCAGVATYGSAGATSKVGISIVFFDARAGVSDRKWVLSSIHQQKLYQGSMIDKTGNFASGRIVLNNGSQKFYSGQFKLEKGANDRYVMLLDGEINDNPAAGGPGQPIKSKLSCIDISI
jgi:hypothetical protein